MTTDPFDPALATAPTRRVAMRRVVDLLCATHAPDRVRSYREAMLRGDRLPPIAVVQVGRFFVVADGHKRISAARALELAQIEVEVWTVTRLLGDLLGQLRRHLAAAERAAAGLFKGREGRREAARFATATAAHWRRMIVSLWQVVSRRSTSP